MSIYQRGKSWYIDIYISGKRIRRKISKSKKLTQEIEAELKTKHRLKQLSIEDIDKPLPFDYVANQYLQYSKDVKSAKTYELESQSYKKHIESFFDGYPINGITIDLLLKYQVQKKSEGLSNRTINIHIGLIRKIIKYSGVRTVKLKYPMLPESERTHAFLTSEETKRFLRYLGYDLTHKRVLFGLMTGMRPAELTYLDWSDIDFEMKTAKVSSKPPLWTIKTKQERIIPLNNQALTILRELWENRKGRWVFSPSDKPIKSIRRAIETARIKAGIAKKVTPNMLRHTFATHALIKGADIKSLQEILGHKDIHTTLRYTHAVKEQLKKTVELVSDL